jgi:hypothetical protein
MDKKNKLHEVGSSGIKYKIGILRMRVILKNVSLI